jgi:hypothetical protein
LIANFANVLEGRRKGEGRGRKGEDRGKAMEKRKKTAFFPFSTEGLLCVR